MKVQSVYENIKVFMYEFGHMPIPNAESHFILAGSTLSTS